MLELRKSVAVCLAALAFCHPAAAAPLFVDVEAPSCSDTISRAQAQNELTPFCSLQPAADVVEPGDRVRVKAGEYVLPALLDLKRGGSDGSPVSFEPYGNGSVTIVGPAADAGVIINADYVVFQGFEIKNSGATGLRNNGSFVVMRKNQIHDNARGCPPTIKCGQGIASNSKSTVGVLIEDNVSYRNGSHPSQDHCYYLAGQKLVIRNNVGWDCSGYGFQVYPDCDDCDVYNNVAYGNAARSGFVLGGEAYQSVPSMSSNMRVYNNIAAMNGQAGFHVYNNGGGGIALVNNLVFGNPKGAVSVTDANSKYTEVGTIDGDPLFVAPNALDWHLTPKSPAIDAGSNQLFAPFDIDGEQRPMGSGVDIGVDELGNGGGAGGGAAGASPGGASSSGGAGAGASGSGGSSGTKPADSDSGCACSAPPRRPNDRFVGLLALACAALVRRRAAAHAHRSRL